MQDNLVKVIDRSDLPEQPRSHALGALSVIDPKANLAHDRAQCLADAGKPIGMREWAAHLLGGIDRAQAKAALLNILPVAPERLQGAVAAALVRRREGADALLNAIASGKASARLLAGPQCDNQPRELGPAQSHRSNRRAAQRPAARRRQADRALQPPARRLSSTPRPTRPWVPRYSRSTAQICHQLAGKGAKVGPQLDGIGTRGLDRLMEDILDPNRNVDQTLRVTNLALKNGQIVSGLLLREEGEVLIVADSQGKEVRVPKIVSRRTGDLAAVANAGQPG